MDAYDPILYLASPYSHQDAKVRDRRHDAVCQVAARLIRGGLSVYSPIAHSHYIARHGIGETWLDWERLDLSMLSRCDGLAVAMLDGWEQSQGVREEIRVAHDVLRIPVVYLTDWLQVDAVVCERIKRDLIKSQARRAVG